MGTGINHLVRRAGCYWWRRRIGRLVAVGLEDTIAPLLHIADPLLARRRARRCSAAFDDAIMRLMAMDRPPTRSELKAMLYAVFRGVLDDGKEWRAARPPGEAPDWIPCPQDDSRHEGLEPEQWHLVPTEPQLIAWQWRDVELLNDAAVVEPLVRRAMKEAGVPQPSDGVPWRRYLQLALRAAADAHEIDARREHGDFFAGYPASCRIPPEAISPFGPELQEPSATYADWMASKVSRSPKTRRQGEAVRSCFYALVDERSVAAITQAVAERFRDRLRRVPGRNRKGIYAGLPLSEAVAAADAIEAALEAGDGPIRHAGKLFPRDRAGTLTLRISLKTINRDMTFLVDWRGWMAHSDERRDLLARGRNPFTGMLIEKRTVARERCERSQASLLHQRGGRAVGGELAHSRCGGGRRRTSWGTPLCGTHRNVPQGCGWQRSCSFASQMSAARRMSTSSTCLRTEAEDGGRGDADSDTPGVGGCTGP